MMTVLTPFLYHRFFSVYIEAKNCGHIKANIMVNKGEHKWQTGHT
jgi:hypothetical protein